MTTTQTASPMNITMITAEDAPVGVQLWPTTTPAGAPNFTLIEVLIRRGEVRTYVEWIYESGTTRTFDLGQQVACSIAQD